MVSANNITAVFSPYFFENPYQNLLTEALEKNRVRVLFDKWKLPLRLLFRHPDVIHLHWLYAFYSRKNKWLTWVRFIFFCFKIWVFRSAGVRIVWTCHEFSNLHHPYPSFDRWSIRFMVRYADAVIVHSRVMKLEMVKRFNIAATHKIHVVPHGEFKNTVGDGPVPTREEARARLGISLDKLMFLHPGHIKPYKNVPFLIDTFKKLGLAGSVLVVCGKPDSEATAQALRSKVMPADPVRLALGFVTESELQTYVQACDICVYAFKDITTSGSVILAMSYSRACIAPRMGDIPELLDEKGAFLYDADNPEGLSGAMIAAWKNRTHLARMGKMNYEIMLDKGWPKAAELTRELYSGKNTHAMA